MHGHLDIAEYLIDRRADVTATARDGNSALHVAAFFCNFELVDLLLKNGASVSAKNRRGQTPIDVVSSPWSRRLADAYESIADRSGLKLDLDRIERNRTRIAKKLRD